MANNNSPSVISKKLDRDNNPNLEVLGGQRTVQQHTLNLWKLEPMLLAYDLCFCIGSL